MTDKETMKMALEALTNPSTIAVQHAIANLKIALAQPEQEPVAWRKKVNGVWHYFDESTPFPFDDCEPLYEKH